MEKKERNQREEKPFADEQEHKATEEPAEQLNQDPFTALMFGPLQANRQTGMARQEHQMQSPPNQQPEIDLEELMVNIDTLIDSVKDYKPYFQKAFSYIEQIWKKK